MRYIVDLNNKRLYKVGESSHNPALDDAVLNSYIAKGFEVRTDMYIPFTINNYSGYPNQTFDLGLVELNINNMMANYHNLETRCANLESEIQVLRSEIDMLKNKVSRYEIYS